MAECIVLKNNLGLSRCNKLPGLPSIIITTPINFKFTPAQLADADSFKTALQNALISGISSRVYLFPEFKTMENISEEAIYEDTPFAYMKVRDGQYRWRFSISESICLHKAMFSHRSTSGRVFIYDKEGQLLGTGDNEGNFYGFTYSLLNTEKMLFNDGSVTSKSPIVLALSNNRELDQSGVILDSSIASVINTVDRLTDVSLSIVGSPAADSFQVKVVATCDSTPIDGLTQADFRITTSSGTVQTGTSFTPNGNGVYTLNKTTDWLDGFVNLVSADTLSLKAYESTGAIPLLIP
jgi:hypothetical protein